MFKSFDKCLDKLLLYMRKWKKVNDATKQKTCSQLQIIIFINTKNFLILLVWNLRSKALMSSRILFKTLFHSLVMKTIMKDKNILGWYH